DVESVAQGCRFTDCTHRSEPGCAVRAALHDGSLGSDRFDAYAKLQREARRAMIATDALARKAERRRWTTISRSVEQHMRMNYVAERCLAPRPPPPASSAPSTAARISRRWPSSSRR